MNLCSQLGHHIQAGLNRRAGFEPVGTSPPDAVEEIVDSIVVGHVRIAQGFQDML